MLRFEWTAFVTDRLLRDVAKAVAVRSRDVAHVRPVIASILAATGGLPFCASRPSSPTRTARGKALFHEAICHFLTAAAGHRPGPGVEIRKNALPALSSQAFAREPLAVNSASAPELEALPEVSAADALEIVRQRQTAGAFTSIDDLVRRIDGIGPARGAKLASLLRFDDPSRLLAWNHTPTGVFAADLQRAVACAEGSSQLERLERTLAAIAAACAATPHPATRRATIRGTPPTAAVPAHPSDWTAVLDGHDYLGEVPKLFAESGSTIDVCMFHIVLPRETHPTFALMDALRAAHARGVAVRVLMDKDTKTDPYLSTIINAPARRFLEAAGIACRMDPSDRLMHSKYCIVDREVVVIGSHNWSSGSYFGFDDLSLAIRSTALAAQATGQFEELWNAGE